LAAIAAGQRTPVHCTVSGTISGVRDYGTVVLVFLDEADRVRPLVFDAGQFPSLLDAEGCTAGELMGRTARYDDDSLHFLEGHR
jgi:hypothetical protein